MKKQNKGFTLIELLVVIAIIVILAGIVIFAVNTARVKARDVQRITNLDQIRLGLELYADDNAQSYPTDTTLAVLRPKYLQVIPVDPATGGAYSYSYCNFSNAPHVYHIAATLENVDNAGLDTDADINSFDGVDWGTWNAVDCGTSNSSSDGTNGDDTTPPKSGIYDLGIK
ncbi:MAG: hypothetical protein COU81_02995 [Candidatus Portnoybacteria bacterium CG10_big_fil_rev_8_21_14_0_10_36_7]|uniref:Type II secretion system protein GspG C-terminal domain-containing protein n=1 Tax=Candidatus Portnoybacteria bacterium CG10_big_fil_rev_8_21_14_0_10_36_7 TaxID=1974812 RepID=A0A2M8KDM1_9BACT|nr:MAG: hypothetical protein COU81_02995 [Candidatus Portnoybacteria bacterium CG10_big_fil_rev_8_21_14_0_10_36_7]